MTKYAKLKDDLTIEFAPKNKGDIINYNLDIDRLIADGYKEFVPAEKEIGKDYQITYQETENQIIEIATEVIPDPAVVLAQAKEDKIQENDIARDEALYQGVTYKDVLFDSDTDQKVNLLAMVSTMTGEETMYWYGKDNTPLLCDKEDLVNLGYLIAQLHTFCWTKNAQIKQAIAETQTVEEVNEIEIEYGLEE